MPEYKKKCANCSFWGNSRPSVEREGVQLGVCQNWDSVLKYMKVYEDEVCGEFKLSPRLLTASEMQEIHRNNKKKKRR